MACDLICGTGRDTLTAEGVGGVTKFRGGMNARRAKWGCTGQSGDVQTQEEVLSLFSKPPPSFPSSLCDVLVASYVIFLG